MNAMNEWLGWCSEIDYYSLTCFLICVLRGFANVYYRVYKRVRWLSTYADYEGR